MMKFLESIYILFIEMAPYLMIGLAFVAILDIYITKKFVKEQIGGKGIGSVVKAALFGVPLPFVLVGLFPLRYIWLIAKHRRVQSHHF